MRLFAFGLALSFALSTPLAALAQRGGARPAPRPAGNYSRPAGGGGGFNLNRDVPQQRPTNANVNRGSNNANYNRNYGNTNVNTNVNRGANSANVNRNYNKNGNNANVNRNYSANGSTANVNKNYNVNGNNANVNKSYNANTGTVNRTVNSNTNVNANNVNRNVNVSGNTVNRNVYVANPVYAGPAWGWNRGVVWAPAPTYWGGGFWGPFAAGAATAAIMGSVVRANQTYTSYQTAPNSPGATLLSNYQLQQVQCGPPGLVYVYGPNNSLICANPNNLVAAGNYNLNTNTLSLTSM
jgi:hypothetical protein